MWLCVVLCGKRTVGCGGGVRFGRTTTEGCVCDVCKRVIVFCVGKRVGKGMGVGERVV